MNKLFVSTVVACGLLLLNAPEAAAHQDKNSHHRAKPYNSDSRNSYRRDHHSREAYRDGYRHDYYNARYKRAKEMPHWLKRDRSFRRWFHDTRLRKNRRLSWHQLFDIYRAEHSYYRYRRH
jgi:hypothetical protein